jgi:hypothetical protein
MTTARTSKTKRNVTGELSRSAFLAARVVRGLGLPSRWLEIWGSTFTLSDEQRELCEAVATHRLSWCNGEAGAGKTTSMRVLALYAKETGREIIGLATSQSAAAKLGAEAGIKTYNLQKAIVEEELGRSVIPVGAIVLCDETSMTSYRALDRVTHFVEERGATLAGIGDSAQIKNIEAGSPHEVLRGITQDAGSYVELREVRRQRGELSWMRPVVSATGQAIRNGDAEGVEKFVRELDTHGNLVACEDRDATIAAAAKWYLEKPDAASIVTTKDRLAGKHGNQLVRKGLGFDGSGERFRFVRGTREVTVGERIVLDHLIPRLARLHENDIRGYTK